jgi:Zn-dependent protease with chaperone function
VAIYLLVSIIGAIIFVVLGLLTLFSHAISMAHIQVNGVRLRENQFPELYKKVEVICEKMELNKLPEVYVIESGGMLNAFAAKVFGFFGKNIVVLYSDFVDISLDSNGGEIDYVIAHELAHIKRNHIIKSFLVYPAMWIPFIGVSYSRMAEYTCDRMAAYYTEKPVDAINGLLVFAAGKRLYKQVNLPAFQEQYNEKRGMFVTLMELLSTHPPIPKRIHEIETFLYETPSVPLVSKTKQTFAILFLVFFFFPTVIAGVSVAGIMAIEEFDFLNNVLFENEYTPLMEASQEGDVKRVRELLEAGENPIEMNEYGESSLFIAIANEDEEIIKTLLDNGADVNLQDEYGWTPLMSAVMTENTEIGKILLEQGADPTLEDEDKLSALDHAKDITSDEYIQLIKSYIENPSN